MRGEKGGTGGARERPQNDRRDAKGSTLDGGTAKATAADLQREKTPRNGKGSTTVFPAPSAGLAPVQKPSNRGLSEEKLVYLPPKGFFNRSCRFFDLKKKLWGVPVEAKILSPRADAIKVVLHVSFYKKKF